MNPNIQNRHFLNVVVGKMCFQKWIHFKTDHYKKQYQRTDHYRNSIDLYQKTNHPPSVPTNHIIKSMHTNVGPTCRRTTTGGTTSVPVADRSDGDALVFIIIFRDASDAIQCGCTKRLFVLRPNAPFFEQKGPFCEPNTPFFYLASFLKPVFENCNDAQHWRTNTNARNVEMNDHIHYPRSRTRFAAKWFRVFCVRSHNQAILIYWFL